MKNFFTNPFEEVLHFHFKQKIKTRHIPITTPCFIEIKGGYNSERRRKISQHLLNSFIDTSGYLNGINLLIA